MKVGNNEFPLNFLFPNLVTITSLCFGMSAIKYGLDQRWEICIGLLVISAFLDGMDGRLARMLNASSKFGAELDSLTDFINFGVAPALILYFWALESFPIKGLGWAISLTYAISVAFRLARFNAMQGEEKEESSFFEGIPAPCGAGLAVVPVMLSFDLDIHLFQNNPIYLSGYLLAIAFLMTSEIPTPSIKNVHIRSSLVFPLLFCSTVFIALLIIKPWIFLPIIGAFYILIIPVAIIKCQFSGKSSAS